MLLGKRSGHPMKRTTSMTGITVDVSDVVDEDIVQQPIILSGPPPDHNPFHELIPNANSGYDQSFLAMVSPKSASTNDHVVESTPPFLRYCCLCQRRLAPGRDIYMYRGDTAFCSLECREQQMKQDERKEKLHFVASNKEDRRTSSTTTTTTTTSKASTKAEPVAAA
ncbi:hypothetical protein PTKIN_Ptkin08bG0149400 [Pterospermum kingtungense]